MDLEANYAVAEEETMRNSYGKRPFGIDYHTPIAGKPDF
jgi:hypothetical protein